MMVFLNGSRLEFNYSKQKLAVFIPDTNIALRADVSKNQTLAGNSQKIDFAHTL